MKEKSEAGGLLHCCDNGVRLGVEACPACTPPAGLRSVSSYRAGLFNGLVLVVLNPSDCETFDHMTGQRVVIDGVTRYVCAVERFAHAPPYRAGEPIGLLVEPVLSVRPGGAP